MRNLLSNEFYKLCDIIENTEFYVKEESTDARMILVYTTINKDDTQFTCNRKDFDEAFDYTQGNI